MDDKVLIKKLSEFKKAINNLQKMGNKITMEQLQGWNAEHLIDVYCRMGIKSLLNVQCILTKKGG